MLRVAGGAERRVASLRPHAGARLRLGTGKCSQILYAHILDPCVDFEREAAGGSGGECRRFYRVLAGLKDTRYLRVPARAFVAGDYRAARPRAPHQVQVWVYAG